MSIVIYDGPSLLDGAPIVCIASVGSSNVKTGPMVQTWIMRSDMNPSEASRLGLDSSVCGQCPRRHSLGGDCYVQLVHAPRSVWGSWFKNGQPRENWADPREIQALTQDARTYGLRLGSYGDPAAVPFEVWQDLIDALVPIKVVGYTHQWNTGTKELLDKDEHAWMRQMAWLRTNVMASCDSIYEAEKARDMGYRTFTAIPAGTETPKGSVQCPATRESNPLQCHTCGICDGTQGKASRASIYLTEHGMRSQGKAKRVAGLTVLA